MILLLFTTITVFMSSELIIISFFKEMVSTRNVLHDKENISETKNLLLTPNSSKGETTSVEDILKITYKDPPDWLVILLELCLV